MTVRFYDAGQALAGLVTLPNGPYRAPLRSYVVLMTTGDGVFTRR